MDVLHNATRKETPRGITKGKGDSLNLSKALVESNWIRLCSFGIDLDQRPWLAEVLKRPG